MNGFMKAVMRTAGAMNIQVYRLSGGRVMGSVRGVPVLLLTVPGRTSGVAHTSAVGYFKDGDRFVVPGSAGGAPSDPQWFKNLRKSERALVEVGRQRMDVSVSIAGPQEHQVLWSRLLELAPFFADYQAKVKRQVPMAILTPTR